MVLAHNQKFRQERCLQIGQQALKVLRILLRVQQNLRWGVDMLNGVKKISARGTANSEMGYWHIIIIFGEKSVWKLVRQPKGVKNSVRGTAKSEKGYGHAKLSENFFC